MIVIVLFVVLAVNSQAQDVIIQRHFKGDIYTSSCSHHQCPVGTRSSPGPMAAALTSYDSHVTRDTCTCQCDTERPTYRDDVATCVDTISECEVASFITGDLSENIPFVFLPLPGQLVYPSAYVSIPNLEDGSSICVVSKVEMMTDKGWRNINNMTSTASQEFQQPFQLYREAERTYLQWMGKESLHQSLEGRLALVHLLCKAGAGDRNRKLFSPCVSFRIAGSPGRPVSVEEYSGDQSLTQRDYITIGLCAGFLVLLYMFGMIVLIVIKKKQRRDARLREQFLNLPLPTGLGYKSSRILGLDNQLEKNKLAGFNDDVRYSIKTKSFSQIEPKLSRRDEQLESESKVEEKIYDITKSGHQSGTESDHSSVMELNEKLLEAHKKMVQQKLNKEVARDFVKVDQTSKDMEGTRTDDGVEDAGNKKPHANLSKRNSSKFSPKLEEIQEENKNRHKKSNAAFDIPPSLDSGIVTRSVSSHSQSNDDDYNDQSDDTDDDNVPTSDDDSEFLSKDDLKMFGRNGKKIPPDENDIVSDIYSTAFSKVPKVLPSDSESVYSLTSTIDKDFDYDSLDQKLMGNVKHIYRNPNVMKKSSTGMMTKPKVEKEDSYEEILLSKDSKVNKIPGVYINNDYDINTVDNSENEDNDAPSTSNNLKDYDDDKLIYSSEEKMMISITGNTESIFSNKLRIEVNNKQNEKNYAPMKGNNGPNQQRLWTNFAGAEIKKSEDKIPVAGAVMNNTRHQSVNEKQGSPRRPTNDPPSLPPKTRGTPRLPPKTPTTISTNNIRHQSSSSVISGGKRPLPPLPPPRVPPPPPPLPK